MRTRIKICGITNTDDARAAIDYGADALGFVFVPDTPRCIDWLTGYHIGCGIPPFATKVGVYRDWKDRQNSMPKNFDAFQYYSNERGIYRVDGTRGYSRHRGIRAYRVRNQDSLIEIESTCHETHAILLDTYSKDKLGGSGETFNWELAVEAKRRFGKPIILAGGLTPENVQDAIATVRPYAVDVSSGVEAEPGRKDHAKLKAFIWAVKEFDLKYGLEP